jgi:hypothetical protein
MFENEFKLANELEDLAYDLSESARQIRMSARELDCCINDLSDPGSFDNVDWDSVFNDMSTAEADAGIYLKYFDKVLNRIIAARVKLGNFEVSL